MGAPHGNHGREEQLRRGDRSACGPCRWSSCGRQAPVEKDACRPAPWQRCGADVPCAWRNPASSAVAVLRRFQRPADVRACRARVGASRLRSTFLRKGQRRRKTLGQTKRIRPGSRQGCHPGRARAPAQRLARARSRPGTVGQFGAVLPQAPLSGTRPASGARPTSLSIGGHARLHQIWLQPSFVKRCDSLCARWQRPHVLQVRSGATCTAAPGEARRWSSAAGR